MAGREKNIWIVLLNLKHGPAIGIYIFYLKSAIRKQTDTGQNNTISHPTEAGLVIDPVNISLCFVYC